MCRLPVVFDVFFFSWTFPHKWMGNHFRPFMLKKNGFPFLPDTSKISLSEKCHEQFDKLCFWGKMYVLKHLLAQQTQSHWWNGAQQYSSRMTRMCQGNKGSSELQCSCVTLPLTTEIIPSYIIPSTLAREAIFSQDPKLPVSICHRSCKSCQADRRSLETTSGTLVLQAPKRNFNWYACQTSSKFQTNNFKQYFFHQKCRKCDPKRQQTRTMGWQMKAQNLRGSVQHVIRSICGLSLTENSPPK